MKRVIIISILCLCIVSLFGCSRCNNQPYKECSISYIGGFTDEIEDIKECQQYSDGKEDII